MICRHACGVNFTLSHGDVEAALFDLVFDVAATFGAGIAQYLGEDVLECVVAHLAAAWSFGWLHGMVAVVGDVEGGAEAVTALLGSIAVMAAQAAHIFLGAKYAGNDDSMQGHPFDRERIKETTPDVLQQHTRTRHQIRNAAPHTRIHHIIRVGPHVEELALALLRLLTVFHGAHPMSHGGGVLHLLKIGETVLIGIDAANRMRLTPLLPPLRGSSLCLCSGSGREDGDETRFNDEPHDEQRQYNGAHQTGEYAFLDAFQNEGLLQMMGAKLTFLQHIYAKPTFFMVAASPFDWI